MKNQIKNQVLGLTLISETEQSLKIQRNDQLEQIIISQQEATATIFLKEEKCVVKETYSILWPNCIVQSSYFTDKETRFQQIYPEAKISFYFPKERPDVHTASLIILRNANEQEQKMFYTTYPKETYV